MTTLTFDQCRLADDILLFISLQDQATIDKVHFKNRGNEFHQRIHHLMSHGFLEKKHNREYITTTGKGHCRLPNTFTEEFQKKEKEEILKAKQEKHLNVSTSLATEQLADMRRLRLKSIAALIISIISLVIMVGLEFYKLYLNDNKTNQYDNQKNYSVLKPLFKDFNITKIKDTSKKVEGFSHFSRN